MKTSLPLCQLQYECDLNFNYLIVLSPPNRMPLTRFIITIHECPTSLKPTPSNCSIIHGHIQLEGNSWPNHLTHTNHLHWLNHLALFYLHCAIYHWVTSISRGGPCQAPNWINDALCVHHHWSYVHCPFRPSKLLTTDRHIDCHFVNPCVHLI